MGIGKYINRVCSVMDTKVVGPLLKGASSTLSFFKKRLAVYQIIPGKLEILPLFFKG